MSSDVALNIAAASTAGACQISLFHPLDCLRIRYQLAGRSTDGWVAFTWRIVRREGWWNGLHRPGLAPNIMAVASSQGARMGVYPSARDSLMRGRPEQVRPDLMLLAGLASGSIGYFLSAPLWMIKTRMQGSAQLQGVAVPTQWPVSVLGYWTGCTPLVARGALLTSGQMAGYDATKRISRRHGLLADGPTLHVVAATVAGFSAATFSAPADVVQTRLQTGTSSDVVTCMREVWTAHGPIGFYRGWSVNVLRLVPTFIVGATVYEQVRKLLGIGYFK